MDYLQKSYIRHFQPTADNLGMHRTRHTYVRVTNDLMQTFTLKRYRFGHECTIVFAIVPLCFGITHVDMERYNLRQFLVQRDIGEWRYDAQDEQNMDTCMMDSIDDYWY